VGGDNSDFGLRVHSEGFKGLRVSPHAFLFRSLSSRPLHASNCDGFALFRCLLIACARRRSTSIALLLLLLLPLLLLSLLLLLRLLLPHLLLHLLLPQELVLELLGHRRITRCQLSNLFVLFEKKRSRKRDIKRNARKRRDWIKKSEMIML